MKNRISIKRVILIPYLLVIVSLMLIVGFVYKYDYNWLVEVQGARILNALNENTNDRLEYFLEEPMNMSKVYAGYISRDRLYEGDDLSKVESFSLDFFKTLLTDIPQISTIGYGDESGNYIGYRIDHEKNQLDLMLKDKRTNHKLIIFDGHDVESNIIASYDNYDPRVRPWYVPVKKNPKLQWSDFYINMDEKKEATISILVPVKNVEGAFKGVCVIDVKLEGINAFLKSENGRFGGVVYIADALGQLVGQSDESPIVVQSGDKATEGRLLKAIESPNELTRESGKLVQKNQGDSGGMKSIEAITKPAYYYASNFNRIDGLNWTIVVALPETALMGDVISHQWITLFALLSVMLVGMVLGLFMLSKITQPVVLISDAIRELSERDFETKTNEELMGMESEELFSLRETTELIESFNKLTLKLNVSFRALKESEEKYRSLVENADDIIYSLDENNRFVAVNEAFEKVTGMNRQEVVGKSTKEISSLSETLIKWEQDLALALNAIETVKEMTYILNSEGKRQTYKMTTSPVYDGLGNRTSTTGTCHNITDIIEAEAEKIASLSYVVTGIAHEINTPVGNCITIASYLLSELRPMQDKVNEGTIRKLDMQRFIDTIHDSCSQIVSNLEKSRKLVDAFKKLAANRTKTDKIEIQLDTFITGIFNSFVYTHQDKTMRLYLEFSNTIYMNCDQIQLMQVFTELFENSYNHGFENQDEGEIYIQFEEVTELDEIDLVYRDNGIGISSGISKDVFTPFFSTKFSSEHSGLGLNVIYNIIRTTFNGEIRINEHYTDGFEIKIRMARR